MLLFLFSNNIMIFFSLENKMQTIIFLFIFKIYNNIINAQQQKIAIDFGENNLHSGWHMEHCRRRRCCGLDNPAGMQMCKDFVSLDQFQLLDACSE